MSQSRAPPVHRRDLALPAKPPSNFTACRSEQPLVLLKGRRVETSYWGFFDLNSIPASGIERIEVLPIGASAIYGADALGGAINIILRRNFDGLRGQWNG